MKIDIQTGDTDKLNMLIQTGKLPDIITLDANSTQRTADRRCSCRSR